MDRLKTSSSPESLLKTSSFSRKSLEPIKEESISSGTDIKVKAKNGSKRNSQRGNDIYPKLPGTYTKPCPFTQNECPTKAALNETYRDWMDDDNYSDDFSYSVASVDTTRKSYSSLLKQPFIFRNVDSLQRAITQDEAKMMEMYLKTTQEEPVEEEEIPTLFSPDILTAATMSSTESSRVTDSISQTETVESETSLQKKRLSYLLGLSKEKSGEEEAESKLASERLSEDEKISKSLTGETAAMRQAQRYLRVHRIFEFYQFLIAHLLSALPDNPIQFLLDLLDKCIIYRAGMGNPPLLYDKKHLEALFNLMDRMRTGTIDKNQYVTGMRTLGICSFNPNPPTTDDMVEKDYFIEEAHENLVSMLNEILRRRWMYFTSKPSPITTPPPTPQYSLRTANTDLSSKK